MHSAERHPVTGLAFLSKKEGPERAPDGTPGRLRHLGNPKFVSIALRLFSLVLILVALLLLCIDMLTSLEGGGQLTVRSLQQVWALADSASLARFTAWVKARDGLAEFCLNLFGIARMGCDRCPGRTDRVSGRASSRTLTVGARRPEHVALALGIGIAACHEQMARIAG